MKRSIFVFFLITIISFLLYSQALSFNYVNLDDTLLIEQSAKFLKNFGNILHAFRQEVFTSADRTGGIFYRPILTISFLLDAQWGISNLIPFRLTNIILHIISSFLVFKLLMKLDFSYLLSFILSLFFTVHPIAAGAVAWLPGRNDTLLTIFIILSFIYFISLTSRKLILQTGDASGGFTLNGFTMKGPPARTQNIGFEYLMGVTSGRTRKSKLIWHLFFFTLALLTKETALILPILCIVYKVSIILPSLEHWNSHLTARQVGTLEHFRKTNNPKLTSLILCTGWLILTVVFLLLRQLLLPNANSYSINDAINNILLQSPGILVYLGKFLLPFNLSVYPNLKDQTIIYGLITLILLLTGIVLKISRGGKFFEHSHRQKILADISKIWIKSKKTRMIIFGSSWFILFLLPTFIIRDQYSAGVIREHRMYLPMIGLLIILGKIDIIKLRLSPSHFERSEKSSPDVTSGRFARFLSRLSSFEMTSTFNESLIVVIFLPLFAITTFLHTRNFQDAKSFWQNAVTTSPTSPVAQLNLGAYFASQKDWGHAETYYKKALSLTPNLKGSHNNLGVVYMNKNQLKEAEAEFKKELELNPGFEMARRNLELLQGDALQPRKASP